MFKEMFFKQSEIGKEMSRDRNQSKQINKSMNKIQFMSCWPCKKKKKTKKKGEEEKKE